MSVYKFKEIVKKANECQSNVKKKYSTGISDDWTYYFAKAVISPKKDITKFSFKSAKKPTGTDISRQIKQSDYLNICKKLVKETETHKQLPNNIQWGKYELKPVLLKEIFSRILTYYNDNGKLPAQVNANSKIFIKPVEYPETVYNDFVKKTGKKPKTLDETLTYVSNHMNYEGYNDDKYSNKQVLEKKRGNCVDLLQWLINMAKAEGYECKCIHVQCRSSGTGHVFGKFRHKKYTENTWITRDPAAVAGGHDIHKIWCADGYVLAVNPSWFLENLQR